MAIYSLTGNTRSLFHAEPAHHIIVKNGKLTQKGVVTCDLDKTIVDIHANQVPNVYDVVDNLHAEKRIVQ
jgi:hypothetical protein